MNQAISHPTAARPRFRVQAGLRLQINTDAASLAVTLTPDEALSLAMTLLYEAREQVAVLQAQAAAAAAVR